MKVSEYIDTVNRRFKKGKIKEKSYRGDLNNLLESLLPNISITNNPKSIRCGGPNLTISQKGLPIGYIKTTDFGKDLNEIDGIEAVRRYKESLSNLITTNYLDFRWYKDGELITSFSLKSGLK
jgi:hypothetical protein